MPEPKAANRFERHPYITLSAILLVLIVLALAASEITLKPGAGKDVVVSGDRPPSPYRYLVLREWQPSTSFFFGAPKELTANRSGKVRSTYAVDVDEFGFIEPSIIHKDPDVEIVFLGGSTTECLYVTPELRFPYLAGRMLEDRLGLKINSINAAKSGNNTMISLLMLAGKILPRRPDYIVLMHNINDLSLLTNNDSYWVDGLPYTILRTRERSLVTLWTDFRDMTIPYTWRAISRAFDRLSLLISPASAETVSQATAPHINRTKLFENALRGFVRFARAWQMEPILMTQVILPSEMELTATSLSVPELVAAHESFNDVVRRVASTDGVSLIDLASAQEWGPAHIYDAMHFNDDGAKAVARLVAEKMEVLLRDGSRAELPHR